MSATLNKLRAPEPLGKPIDFQPVIVVDTREQRPLPFARMRTQTATLPVGDYSILGAETLFAVERKSVADLVSCCMGENRERFERELHRLRGYGFKRLLIVGTEDEIQAGRYRSAITPKAVMATLGAFETRYDLPVVFQFNPGAAAQIERYAYWFAREHLLTANSLLRSSGKETSTQPE